MPKKSDTKATPALADRLTDAIIYLEGRGTGKQQSSGASVMEISNATHSKLTADNTYRGLDIKALRALYLEVVTLGGAEAQTINSMVTDFIATMPRARTETKGRAAVAYAVSCVLRLGATMTVEYTSEIAPEIGCDDRIVRRSYPNTGKVVAILNKYGIRV